MSVQLSEAIIRLSEGQQPNLYSGSINSWTNRPKRPQMTSKVGQRILPLAKKNKTKEVGILLSKSTIKRILWIDEARETYQGNGRKRKVCQRKERNHNPKHTTLSVKHDRDNVTAGMAASGPRS